jgi:hypothetical protein
MIRNLFKKKQTNPLDKYQITEHVSGNWSYHISMNDFYSKSLCGKDVMVTSMNFSQWGIKVNHIPETYCKVCSEALIRRLLK